MKKVRLIFFVLYAAFHLGLMSVSLYADYVYTNSNFNQLIELGKKIPMAKWLALFGILMFLLNITLFFFLNRSHNTKIEALEKDQNKLKAQMFDLNSTKPSQSTDENSESKEAKEV